MSTYEADPDVEPARIATITHARKQWRREGVIRAQSESDFFRYETPEAVRR